MCIRTLKGQHYRARWAEKGVSEKPGFLNLDPAVGTREASWEGCED